jgi:hypothetical protein
MWPPAARRRPALETAGKKAQVEPPRATTKTEEKTMGVAKGISVTQHCAEIDRCNQRGGRMLSIVDLIEAGTFTRDEAAYSLAAINQGASFMVGALPGGAGKTTVMGALLNFVPPDARLVPADGEKSIAEGARTRNERRCYICHEIGAGSYYAYLWDEALNAAASTIDRLLASGARHIEDVRAFLIEHTP